MSGTPPLSWIRLWCDFLSNWKVAGLPEAYQLRLVKLWLIHAQGHLVGASAERLAWELRLPVAEVQATLDALTAAGLLEADGSPHGWERRQPRGDHSAAERQRQRRARRDVTGQTAVTDESRNASRDSHAEKERKKEREERVASDDADTIPYAEIVAHLNQRTGSGYRSKTKSTRAYIHARWTDGFRLEDFQAVIDAKAAEWLHGSIDGKPAATYLRPETLFGTKFESYLQAARGNGRLKAQADADLPDIATLMAKEAANV